MKSFGIKTLMATVFALIISFGSQLSFAQQIFTARNADIVLPRSIPEIMEYTILEIDVNSISNYVHNIGDNVHIGLNLEDISILGTLNSKRSRMPGLITYRTSENGDKEVLNRPEIIFRGSTEGEKSTDFLFAINENLFAGAFSHEGKDYIIEPLWWHIEGMPSDLVILYETSVVQFLEEHQCGVDHTHYIDHLIEEHPRHDEEIDFRMNFNCKTVEYGAALDWSFVNKYGGEAGAWDRVDFVMGLVQFQYTGHFDWDFEYIRSAEYASECSTCDPWTSSTNASTVLSNFRTWGNTGGFGSQTYHVAGFWTNRTFTGGTLGIAYVGGMCNSYRYHALRDWTSASWGMRVMVAHELGHNFNYGHDSGTGWIMSPSVNNTTQWSTPSKNTINSFVGGSGAWCLGNCIPPPPVAGFSSSDTGGCLPVTIDFYDESEGLVTSWLWSFPGGVPSSSTLQNPSVTYSEKGTFQVSLTVSNAGGSDQQTITNYIEIIDIPVTFFEHGSDELTAFFYNMTDGGVFFQWEFGDGGSSNEFNPEHVYPYDGVYLVSLTSSNECGETSYSKWIEIISLPVAEFYSDVMEGCAELTISFQESCSPNTTSWEWNFPGGTPGSSFFENPVVVYDNPGTYEVTLVASNALGQTTMTKSDYITVYEYPVLGFDFIISEDTAFFSVVGNAESFLWQFGDGNISEDINPFHIYAEDGLYLVSLTSYAECGTRNFTEFISIIFPPTAEFSSDETYVCGPAFIQFEDNSSESATSWFWIFEGGIPPTSEEQNPLVFYEFPGVYSVSLTITNPIGEASNEKTNYIEILPQAIAGFDFLIDGKTISFVNTSTNAEDCEWDFGDGNTSDECNPVHNYSDEGTYNVTLSVTNECGTNVYSNEIAIIFPPVADFSASITRGCAPLLIHFEDMSTLSTTAWEWTFEGGNPATSTDKNPEVEYNEPGIYFVSLTTTNPLGQATELKTGFIEIFSTPKSGFSAYIHESEVVFTNSSVNATEYAWDFGDGNSSTEENPVHNYENKGTYTVLLIATNECGSDSTTIEIEIKTTDVRLPDFLNSLVLYPNPNTGSFVIEMTGDPVGLIDFDIADISGKVFYAGKIDFSQATVSHSVELSNVIEGVYMLRLNHKGQTLSRAIHVSRK